MNNYYKGLIAETTGVKDPDKLHEILDTMRVIGKPTLDGYNRREFNKLAKQALEVVNHFETCVGCKDCKG